MEHDLRVGSVLDSIVEEFFDLYSAKDDLPWVMLEYIATLKEQLLSHTEYLFHDEEQVWHFKDMVMPKLLALKSHDAELKSDNAELLRESLVTTIRIITVAK